MADSGSTPVLSTRGEANVGAIMPKIKSAVSDRSTGVQIDLASAENWLIRPEVIVICKEAISSQLTPQSFLYPRAFAGFPEVLDAFSEFFNARFNPKIKIETSHLATAPGAASCVDAVLYNICNPGDGVLVPGPYWSGFDFQFQARSSAVPISVTTPDLASTLTLSLVPALEAAFNTATSPIKGLLISNPHNPLGQCYPLEVLEACMKFCQRKNIHYISDEVYGMTNFACAELSSPVPFISALSMDVESLGVDLGRIHTIWSTSKDFGQSGVRMGCTITQGNEQMAVALALASNTQTSTLSSIFVSALLTSPNLTSLLQANSGRLATAYEKLNAVFKKHSIEYIPSYAGLYVYAKVAPKCETWEEEARVIGRMREEGVLVSGGRAYHGPESEKGWARIGFAIQEEQLEKAIEIMDRVFAEETAARNVRSDTQAMKIRKVKYANELDSALNQLVQYLQSTMRILKGEAREHLDASLHNHQGLPDKRISELASSAVDLLHETEQLLEPGSLVLADHFLGHLTTKCLVAAVELKIPDILNTSPKTLPELANTSNAHHHRLRQVMRVLHNNGIFHYDASSDTYGNNSTSEMLRSNHWTQWHNWVDLYGNEFYDMSRGIPASCRKDVSRMAGQVNFDTDTDMFTYFTQQGWLPRLHKTLSSGAIAQAPGIVEDYPWVEIAEESFLDVGGGGGGLVALLLRKHSHMRAGILDTSKVIEHATKNFHSEDGEFIDVGDRVEKSNLIVGDFLVEVPAWEVYTMKWCLHDWDDSKALKVMGNIRQAITRGPKSRLIILESILAEGRMGRLSRYGDLIMAISANGQERTEAQWRSLAKQSGWEVKAIYHLRNAWPSAIELIPVWDQETSLTNGTHHESDATVEAVKMNGTKTFDVNETKVNGVAKTNGATVHNINGMEAEANGNRGTSNQLSDDLTTTVTSTMSFLEPWDSSKGEPYYRSMPDPGFDSTNFAWKEAQVQVTNSRSRKQKFTLDKNGFCYVDDSNGMTTEVIEALRVGIKEVVQEVYYPKVEELVKSVTGASRVIIFDHTVRKRDPEMKKEDNPSGKEQPATVVHCDQSSKGALRRVKQNIAESEDLEAIMKGRIRMINIWRPLRGPVVDWPLAMMDFQTLTPSDIHSCDLWRHQFEERGQTVTYTHDEKQKWYYLDQHDIDEVTMIKIWDSKTNGTANMCPHAAFQHPDTPPDAAPRESVEVRCIVLD